jgi:peptidoglycan hydrolase CwlO-like protein
MKNFQINLLVFLAACLCGLCAWQWTDQANQRRAIEERNKMIFDRDRSIQGYTNTIATTDLQVADLQQRVTDLGAAAASNQQVILQQKGQITRLTASEETLSNDIVQYQLGVTNLEKKLDEAYDGIKKQNAVIQELVAQRDDFIGKYTNSINARNEIVAKYNALVERVNQMQTNTPAAATSK